MHYYSVFKDRRPQGQTETISLGLGAVNPNFDFSPISCAQAGLPLELETGNFAGARVYSCDFALRQFRFAPLGDAKIHARRDRHQTRDREHRPVAP